jgi:hypothetical protein
MSQAGINNVKGGGGGGTPVMYLTGNTGGEVPPTANNINIVGTGGVLVTGDPGTSTLTITSGDNFLMGTATTTGAATAIISNGGPVDIPLATAGSAASVRVNLVGYDKTAGLAVGGELIGLVRNVAGTLTVVNVDITQNDDDEDHDVAWTLVTSGTNIQVQVTGTANATPPGTGSDVIDWSAIIDYVTVS